MPGLKSLLRSKQAERKIVAADLKTLDEIITLIKTQIDAEAKAKPAPRRGKKRPK